MSAATTPEGAPEAGAATAPLAGSRQELGVRRQNFVLRYFARFDDGELVRCAFGGLLAGAVIILGMDLNDLWHRTQWSTPEAALPGFEAPAVLPPATETGDARPGGRDPRPFLPDDEEGLRAPMRFTLEKGGVLGASGSIDVGAAARFQAEIEARGEYVRIVSLNSPGGSLGDAMAMAKLIRARGLGTRVEDGALCASSCPLVMAGGASRSAGPQAAIGLHQFYALGPGASAPPANPAQAMADAQATTATISRLLGEMGVDPALWLHALDTPPRALYYLSPAEMSQYRLVTEAAPVARAEP